MIRLLVELSDALAPVADNAIFSFVKNQLIEHWFTPVLALWLARSQKALADLPEDFRNSTLALACYLHRTRHRWVRKLMLTLTVCCIIKTGPALLQMFSTAIEF